MKKTLPALILGLLALVGGFEGHQNKFGFSSPTAVPYIITPTSTGASGNATTTQFFGSLLPQSNAQFDLGSPSQSWNNIYASGTANLTNVTISGVCTGCGGGGGSGGPWTDNNAANTITMVTTTRNIFFGGTTTSTAKFVFDDTTGIFTDSGGYVSQASSSVVGALTATGLLTDNTGVLSQGSSTVVGAFTGTGAAAFNSTLAVTSLSTLTGAFVSGASSTVVGSFTDTATATTKNLAWTGSVVMNRVSTNSNSYTLTSQTDFYLAASTTNQAVTVNLPSATSVSAGTQFIIKDRTGNASTNAISVVANGTNTIDGTSTAFIAGNYGFLNIVDDGASNWEILGQ